MPSEFSLIPFFAGRGALRSGPLRFNNIIQHAAAGSCFRSLCCILMIFILHRAFPRDFSREIRARNNIHLHREYNLAMKNKSLRRIADVRSGKR